MDQASPSTDLAVAVTAHDSMRTMPRLLESVQGLAARVVVVDSGSKDGTVELCRERGAEVIHRDWTGHVAQKQFAVEQCNGHRWVLLLDSDESLESELRESIRNTTHQSHGPQGAERAAWLVRRKVWFLGGWLHYTYQPEWRLRLFRGGAARIVGVDPHDRVEVDGQVGKLDGVLRHDSWSDLPDLARRQVRYAEIAARDAGATGGGRPWSLLLHPTAAFLKQFVLKRGMLDGWRGLICAGMTANYTMLKHAFIAAERHGNGGRNR
jgi:glycosyltransferase involved in cell wall biosynthesis